MSKHAADSFEHSNDDSSDEFQYLTNAKVTEIVPLRALLACKLRKKKKSLTSRQGDAELIPEVFITGEILSGDGFLCTQSGVFCSWHFQWHDPWVLLEVIFVFN